MSTRTQYNPDALLNERLLEAGASKTVYALASTATERVKREVFNSPDYFDMFRGAWTGKQDSIHEEFFDAWTNWSKPVVDFDRTQFPFNYPCNGASEAIRQIIFDLKDDELLNSVHAFEGEYEGYKAMAEAAGLRYVEHKRANWRDMLIRESDDYVLEGDLFFISQPSAIDGMVWSEFNEFVEQMPPNRLVVDVTYVGAVPQSAVPQRFNLKAPSINSVIFSLSKPFGCYYDRIGGVFMREESPALFGNRWFKNLTSLAIGTALLKQYKVFHYANASGYAQQAAVKHVSRELGIELTPCDVFILATAESAEQPLADYLRRGDKLRICLTPYMAGLAGTV